MAAAASPMPRPPAAPPDARSTVPTSSPSVPTAATSTWARSRATRSRCSPAMRSTGALTQPTGTTGCITNTADLRLHHRPRAGRSGGHGDQRRRRERLRRRRDQQRPRRAHSQPVDRRADAGDRRHRLHRRECARRLHDRHAARRRGRGGGQSRRRRRVRDIAAQQQRDGVHSHADDRPARPADRHLRLRDLRVGRRLLAWPHAQRSRGPGRLARRRERLRGGVRLRRDRRLQSQRRLRAP